MFTPLTILQNSWTSTEKRDKMLALQGITMDALRSYCYLAERIRSAIWGRPVKRGSFKGIYSMNYQRNSIWKITTDSIVLMMLLMENWF
jgi:hypothetical protein